MDKKYFYEVFEDMPRQGPGSNISTIRAFKIVKGYLPDYPQILDIGCGKGVQTLELANIADATIHAIDDHAPFIDHLITKVDKNSQCARIFPQVADMTNLNFKPSQFHLIWSEGSIFIMGFEKGLQYLKKFLSLRGYVVVSEAVWLKPDIPHELKKFWDNEYPEIGTINEKKEIIKKTGYGLIMNFSLPKTAWETFYGHMQKAIAKYRELNKNDIEANKVYDTLAYEIEIYNKYSDYFGYEFFVMRNMKKD